MPADPMTMLSQANLTGVDILVSSNKDEGRHHFDLKNDLKQRFIISYGRVDYTGGLNSYRI